MDYPSLTGLAAAIAFCSVAQADVPAVATDIAPVHSLVSQVMGDLGEPDFILLPGASPHGYSLRPSEARALARADLVFWIGEDLTPWLEGPIETLAGNAEAVALLDLPGTRLKPFREDAVFSVDDHAEPDDHDDHADHHDHDDHAGEGDHADHDDHEDHGEHDEHAEDAAGHEGHDHSGIDPHAWLDPQNAILWIDAISAALAEKDPDNAGTYAANAEHAKEDLTRLMSDVSARLDPVRGLAFVVFHDAYRYFEDRFDMPALGAISFGDATDPGAARVAELSAMVRAKGVGCFAAEPQFNPALVKTVAGGGEISTTVLDPLGTEIEPGPDFYGALISGLADSLLACRQ